MFSTRPQRAVRVERRRLRRARRAVAWQRQRARRAERRGVVIRLNWRLSTALAAAVACLLAVLGGAPVSQAAPAQAIQSVGVQVGPDGSVTGLTSTTAVRDNKGAVSGTSVRLDPLSDGQALPVRVSTAWWLGDNTGTNLSDLRGKSGRITIEISLENLTLAPQTVSLEDGGAKYRQYALIGVPMTATMSTRLGKDALSQVVTLADDGSNATNGVVSQAASDETVVQWAAIMAPPMLPPTAIFRLVMDATNFTPPEFDLMVQPGLVTDPSIEQLVATASGLGAGSEQQQETTLSTVMDVATELQQGQGLVDDLYRALTDEASQLGSQTYSELQAGSTDMLAQIDATSQALSQIGQMTSSQVGAVENQANSDLTALIDRLNTDVLGSTTDPLTLNEGSVAGCSITFPSLPDDAPKTLAATVRLVQAQLDTIISAFAEPDPSASPGSSTAPLDNCRSLLIDDLAAQLGQPGDLCLTGVTDESLRCRLKDAQNSLTGSQTDLTTLRTDLISQLNDQGITELGSYVAQMATDLRALRAGLGDIHANATNASNTVNALLTVTLPDLKTDIDSIRDQVDQLLDPTPPAGTESLVSVAGELRTWQVELSGDRTTIEDHQTAINTAVSSITGQAGLIADATGSGGDLAQAISDLIDAWNGLDPIVTAASGLPADTINNINGGLANIYNNASDIQNAVDTYNLDPSTTAVADLLVPGAGLDGLAADLGAAASALDAMVVDLGDLRNNVLTAIWFNGPGNDGTVLATLEAGLTSIVNSDPATPGDLDQAVATATALITFLGDRFSDTVVPGASCPISPPGPSANPYDPASFDSVIWLSNYLSCGLPGITQALQDGFDATDASLDGLGSDLTTAISQNDDALSVALGDVDLVTGALSGGLASTSLAITQDNLTTIDDAQTQDLADLAIVLNDFASSTNSVVTGMLDQIDAANLNAAASRQALQQDFAIMLTSLGSPDQSSRVGLLGQLHATAAKASNTVDVLESVRQQVLANGATVSGQLVDLKLQAAQYQAARDRLASLPGFPGLPSGLDNVVTVYAIHVSGQ